MGVGCVGRACEGSRSSSFVFVSNVRRLRRLRRLRLSCRASRREVTTGEEPGDFRRDKFPAQEGPAGSRLARVRSEGSRGSSHPRLPGWLEMDPRWWRGARGPDPRRGSTASRGRSRICASQIAAHHDPSKPKQKPQDSARQQAGSYRGIQKKSEHAWSASIFVTCLDRQWMLGTFPTAELAAQMYDAAAHVVFGDDACYNFPDAPNHDPPLAKDVAQEQLNRRPGKRTTCAKCGQECPVKNKNCFVCRTPLKAFNAMKGVQRRLLPGATRPKFMAVFSLGGRTTTLGTYWTEEEAAYHYDREARTVHQDCDDPQKQRCNYLSLEAAKEAAERRSEAGGGERRPASQDSPQDEEEQDRQGRRRVEGGVGGAKPEEKTRKNGGILVEGVQVGGKERRRSAREPVGTETGGCDAGSGPPRTR